MNKKKKMANVWNDGVVQLRLRQCKSSTALMNRIIDLMQAQEESISVLLTRPQRPQTMEMDITGYDVTHMGERMRDVRRMETIADRIHNAIRNSIYNERTRAQTTQTRGLSDTQISNCTRTTLYSNIVSPVNRECPITQEPFEDEDTVMQIDSCGHIFKKESLLLWFSSGTCCPLCRVDLRRQRARDEDPDSRETFEVHIQGTRNEILPL